MSNTVLIHNVRTMRTTHTKSLYFSHRERVEARALRAAEGLPVIYHDIDWPRAEIVGPTTGELHSLHVFNALENPDDYPWVAERFELAQRILDLGGTLTAKLTPTWHTIDTDGIRVTVQRWIATSTVEWRLPRQLDLDAVERMFR